MSKNHRSNHGRKTVRIESEQSQPYVMSASKARTLANAHEELRKRANRILELEKQIAKLSRGRGGGVLHVETTPEVMVVLDKLTNTGFYGTTRNETAEELLRTKLRSEMAWLATGSAS